MSHMDKDNSSITKFDMLYTSNQIQILKVLLPFLDPPIQKRFAIYIKYMELKLSFEKLQSKRFIPFSQRPFSENIEPLCDELSPFLGPKEQESLSQIKNTMKSFHDMKDTMEMFQMMQETMSEEEMGELMKNGMGFF